MKLLASILIFWWIIGFTNAVWYPFCITSEDGKSCEDLFVWPEWLSSSQVKEPVIVEQLVSFEDENILLGIFHYLIDPLTRLYEEYLFPYFHKFKETQVFTYVIYLFYGGKKVETDNKLYMLFIMTCLTFYMVWSLGLFCKVHNINNANIINKILDIVRVFYEETLPLLSEKCKAKIRGQCSKSFTN